MSFITEQERFWAGDFGNDYVDRNKSEQLLAANIHYFSKALNAAGKIGSVIEFGANVGMNLKALKLLFPEQKQFGVEINAKAATELIRFLGESSVYNGSLFNYETPEPYDLSLTKGVLIHLNPDLLPVAYDKLYQSSRKYILIGEYFNPSPVTIDYRGNAERLYKRDFCGELLETYPDLRLVDYGFAYKKDPAFSQDNITWFLMEKRAAS